MQTQKNRVVNGKTFTIFGDTEDQSVFNNIMNGSDYENHMVDFYKELLNKDSVCVDVGANIGILSMYMSLFTEAPIYAFEPIKDTFEFLKKNIEFNKMNVTPFNIALSDFTGKTQFEYDPKKNGSATFSKNGTVEVEVMKLDDFVETNKIEKIDVIKMDIEGFETHMMYGAQNVIENMRPDIVTEYCPPMMRERGFEPNKFFHILESYYKNIYLVDRPVMQLIKVTSNLQLETILNSGYHNIGDVFATNKSL